MFELEIELVEKFMNHIKSDMLNISIENISREFYYNNGRTDLIALTSDQSLIAFEAKLKDWKKAMTQAYRNTLFANYSYVVLPASKQYVLDKAEHDFIRRRIGLVLVDSKKSWIAIDAKRNKPILPWLQKKANLALLGASKC